MALARASALDDTLLAHIYSGAASRCCDGIHHRWNHHRIFFGARLWPQILMSILGSSIAGGSGEASCACFSLCNVEDTAVFRSSIPRWVNSSESPWYGYLCSVYGEPHTAGAPPLPFDLGSLNFFYHVWPIASCDASGKASGAPRYDRPKPKAKCADDVCEPWMAKHGEASATTARRPVAEALAFLHNKSHPWSAGCRHCPQTAEEDQLQLFSIVLPDAEGNRVRGRPQQRFRSRGTAFYEPLQQKSPWRWMGVEIQRGVSSTSGQFYTP